MTRPRSSDPSNLPLRPNPAATPEREAELVEEFLKRLEFIRGSYRFAEKALRNDQVWFNESLMRLRRRFRSKRKSRERGERIHPEIEAVITHHARRFAAAEKRDVGQKHVENAAWIAASTLKARRGRPESRALEYHVVGLVALIQNMSAFPVLARKYRDSVYDPHFAEGISQIVPRVFQQIEPGLSTTRLVNIVLKARRENAGERLSFLDLFPFYSATLAGDGNVQLRPGLRLEAFEHNIPIYCP